MRRALGMWMLFGMLALTVSCVNGGNYEPTRGGQSATGVGSESSGGAARGSTQLNAPAGPIYTAYNLWFEKADHLYSTGYHVGAIIPAGTQVTNVSIDKVRNTNWITFRRQPGGDNYKIEFVEKHHPGLTAGRFCARLFTPESLGALTEGFSEGEMQAVKTGQLQVGMSKKAVLVTYGYPPEIRTPLLAANTWTFWENRFNSTLR